MGARVLLVNVGFYRTRVRLLVGTELARCRKQCVQTLLAPKGGGGLDRL